MADRVIRPAREADSRFIAEMFLISSDGLAAYIWRQDQGPDESLIDAGARRYARRDQWFSYEHCLIAEDDDRLLGMAHCFPMSVDPGAPAIDDPVLQPYIELEDDGSLYLSGLAVIAPMRAQGIGSVLLAAVEAEARRKALPRVSLICFDANEGAMRLYRRRGYVERDRRPLVPHPCLHYTSGDAVLLVKAVA
ncbi:MAG: GNAT family N-acetyltransferase [Geminicoccaceae bacterium]